MGEKSKEPNHFKCGVVIEHGCKKTIFLSKKTLEDMCMVICPKCGGMINLSLFESTVKQQLLDACEEFTEEGLIKRLVA